MARKTPKKRPFVRRSALPQEWGFVQDVALMACQRRVPAWDRPYWGVQSGGRSDLMHVLHRVIGGALAFSLHHAGGRQGLCWAEADIAQQADIRLAAERIAAARMAQRRGRGTGTKVAVWDARALIAAELALWWLSSDGALLTPQDWEQNIPIRPTPAATGYLRRFDARGQLISAERLIERAAQTG